MSRILFFTDDLEDYLADSILHGLISANKHEVTDYPKKELLYKECFPATNRSKVYGNGFTLYGLLDSRRVNRALIWKRIESQEFDIIILGNIWRQFSLLQRLETLIDAENVKIVILDGDDDSRFYPYSVEKLKKDGISLGDLIPWKFNYNYKYYFKRELDQSRPHTWLEYAVPRTFRPRLRNVMRDQGLIPRQCSFSIPESWILKPDILAKSKQFPSHIVDKEVSELFNSGQAQYAFNNPTQYFKDISEAYYGITTKRSGWDCLRHYEIAAAGSVICFKDLDKKPKYSAPHDLNSSNCISYNSAIDLKRKLTNLSSDSYKNLLVGSQKWIANNTTIKSAERLLKLVVEATDN